MSNKLRIGFAEQGMGFWSALTLILITLKLTGHLPSWSWGWVLFPVWISAGLFTLVGLFFCVVAWAGRQP